MKKFFSVALFACLITFPAFAEEVFWDSVWWRTATPEQVEYQLNNGFDIKQKDESGGSVLMYAASESPNPTVIETLIKHGADVNAKDKSNDTVLIYLKKLRQEREKN